MAATLAQSTMLLSNIYTDSDEFMFRYNNRHVAATTVERLGYYMDVEE